MASGVEAAIYAILAADGTAGPLVSTHGLTTGDALTLTTTVADLPAPLAVATTYYARAATANTCTLHPTAADAGTGANTIDITDAGSGTHTAWPTARRDEWFTFTADPATDALTATRYRISPLESQQGAILPYIVYQRIAGPRLRSLDGASGMATPRIQLDIWDDSYADTKTLADAVRNALDDYAGVIAGYTVRDLYIEDEGESFLHPGGGDELRAFGMRQDYVIWFEE